MNEFRPYTRNPNLLGVLSYGFPALAVTQHARSAARRRNDVGRNPIITAALPICGKLSLQKILQLILILLVIFILLSLEYASHT